MSALLLAQAMLHSLRLHQAAEVDADELDKARRRRAAGAHSEHVGFDESKHPRAPAGSPNAGQFVGDGEGDPAGKFDPVEDIFAALKRAKKARPGLKFGLRVIPGEYKGVIKPGDTLPPSKKWVDGEETGKYLSGTSAVSLGSDANGVKKALILLGAHEEKNRSFGHYYGDRVVLIGGETSKKGVDDGEVIIGNAQVIEVWHKGSTGRGPVIGRGASAIDVAKSILGALHAQASEQVVIKAALPNDLVGGPLYVALRVMPGSAAALATWMADQGIENPVPPGDLHITTVYSRTPVPLYQLYDKPKEVTEQLDPASYELGILGEEGALVMFVDSPMACASHEYAAGLGASWDYPSYRPHVTLSYQPGATMPAAPPPFAIEVGAEFARRLDDKD